MPLVTHEFKEESKTKFILIEVDDLSLTPNEIAAIGKILSNQAEGLRGVESISGGRAQGISTQRLVKAINKMRVDGKQQIEMGIKVEMEHTHDPVVSEEIVRDHLVEFPDYYTYLDRMERELEKKWEGKWFPPIP